MLDNLSTGLEENLNPQAKFYNIDVNSSSVEKIFSGNKIDLVFHLASQVDLNASIADPLNDAEINIIGSINLMKFSAKYGIEKFIFSSSGGAIYGEQESFPADELHPTLPQSPYGLSKLTVEKYLDFYSGNYGLNSVSLRYSNVYGPRQNLKGEAGVVSIFCRNILKGIQPVINGNGEQTRDFVFVDDVVDANLKAMELPGSGVFNISTSIEITVNELFANIANNYDYKNEPEHSVSENPGQFRSVLSNNKAKEYLNWQPKTNLEKGLQKTCEWFRNYFKNE